MTDILERIDYELRFGEYTELESLLEEAKGEITKLREELKKREELKRKLRKHNDEIINRGGGTKQITWQDAGTSSEFCGALRRPK